MIAVHFRKIAFPEIHVFRHICPCLLDIVGHVSSIFLLYDRELQTQLLDHVFCVFSITAARRQNSSQCSKMAFFNNFPFKIPRTRNRSNPLKNDQIWSKYKFDRFFEDLSGFESLEF